ncbi:MAG: SCP2 sterol-binding domain-containing protein [Chloroflexota bacterium]|nr:SCP2 sterol-binding domain-containing protein [Chloroflexota bacterium]
MSNQTPGLRPKNIAQAIEGMALSFNPEAAGDIQATIQFHVSGQDGGDWNLTIADGQCRCQNGMVAEPTLTINTPADIWLAIARKERSGAMALMTGKYKASGKMSLLLKMDNIFSRQATEAELAAKGWL